MSAGSPDPDGRQPGQVEVALDPLRLFHRSSSDEPVAELEDVTGADRHEQVALAEPVGEDLLGPVDVDEPVDPPAGSRVGCGLGDVEPADALERADRLLPGRIDVEDADLVGGASGHAPNRDASAFVRE